MRTDLPTEQVRRELSELEFDAMQLLARTERWLVVQRDRARERVDALESQREKAVRQRDVARQRAARLRDRLTKKRERMTELRQDLRAERARPWARLRQAVRRRRT